MSKDTKETVVETKEAAKVVETTKEKKLYRRPDTKYYGRLYVPEEYKRPGRVTRFVKANDVGRIEYLKSIGYQIVTENVEVGNGSLASAKGLGSAVTIEGAISGTSDPQILMDIDQETFDMRQKEKAKDNDMYLKQSKRDGKVNRQDENLDR